MSDVPEIRMPVKLHIDQCHPRTWNPNEMTDDKFDQLDAKVREEGFTDPLKVCPVSEDEVDPSWLEIHKGPHYWIVAGEHRWRMMKLAGGEEILAVVYEDWDELEQKLKCVRDNIIHGEPNPRKLTDLVKSIDPAMDVDPSLFGFSDEAEMSKFLLKEKTQKDKTFMDGLKEDANKKLEAVDSITDIVTNIISQTAKTIDQSLLAFTYKGQTHFVVMCDKKTFTSLSEMTEYLEETGIDVNEFMGEAIADRLEKRDSN